ncbi:MAG: hypothetical protein LBB79_06840 [Prevotellaceae bacterium]|jgi:hypothetical protein|nr:hypothetical protein [Prevotellaceae bacterium]
MDKDILKSYINGTGASCYGEMQVRFKKDKVVATFTMEDSLNSHLIASLTTDPKFSSFGSEDKLFKEISKGNAIQKASAVDFTKKYASVYIELQYHGKLGVDAIESIFIPANNLHLVDMKVLNKFMGKFKVYTEKNEKLKEVLLTDENGKLKILLKEIL